MGLKCHFPLYFVLCYAFTAVLGLPHKSTNLSIRNVTNVLAQQANCFPSLDFEMPSSVPESLTGWWCDPNTEYAFMGFSYEVTACQSLSQLRREFKDMRETFKARYVRLYGFCDTSGFYDNLVTAAWENTLGVHALIWFGFDGGNEWMGRRNSLFSTLFSNPKAKFITRAVQFGSEPLYDNAISASQLASQVNSARSKLASLGIQVTVSEMAYGYQLRNGASNVISAVDFLDIHMLPYFSTSASTASESWPILMNDHDWFVSHGKGKKMYWSQNGWPSTHYPGVEPNSPKAVADISNEKDYYELLDSRCSNFKEFPNGGVGWFWHIYSDAQEPGYGLYDDSGKTKFLFRPKTSC